MYALALKGQAFPEPQDDLPGYIGHVSLETNRFMHMYERDTEL